MKLIAHERLDVNIETSKKQFLQSLPGTLTKHVERAIDEYIDKIRSKSVASSKSKRGDTYE